MIRTRLPLTRLCFLLSGWLATIGLGTATAANAQSSSAKLVNISTRAVVLPDYAALFAGFIITGSEPKQVIIRGIGPSLASTFSGTLADPTLQLFDSHGTELGANDQWATEPGVQQTGLAPTDPSEAAIVRTLNPGAYTAILRGKDNSAGMAVVELYDLSGGSPAVSRLANISSRGVVGPGDYSMIAGVIVTSAGGQQAKIVVRALGPSLAQAGVPETLPNPVLELFNASGTKIAANDDWRSDQETEIATMGLGPRYDEESTIIVNIAQGGYTAVVRDAADSIGLALVEVYAIEQ